MFQDEPMTPHQEKRVLDALLKQLGRPDPGRFVTRLLKPLLWLALVAAFVVLFQLGPHNDKSIMLVALGSAALGILASCVIFYVIWAKQWPVVRRHMSRESIERRINELET